jgi:TPR repeat protein
MRRIVLGIAAMVLLTLLGVLSLHRPAAVKPPVPALPAPGEPTRIEIVVASTPPAASVIDTRMNDLLVEAMRGDVSSQARLCAGYVTEAASTNDYSGAARWCALAAIAGDAESQSSYARMFQLGAGVAQDDLQASEWYEKAAAQQHPYAMYMLGKMLVDQTDPADSARGVALLQSSAALGNSSARLALERMGIEREERKDRPLLTQPSP